LACAQHARRTLDLKARVADLRLTTQTSLELPATDLGTRLQVDTHFGHAGGGLMFREEDGASPRLIGYHLRTYPGQREVRATVSETTAGAALRKALSDVLGVDVVVTKTRRLLQADNVRIHVDEVSGIPGGFVELEIDVPDSASRQARERELDDVRVALQIEPDDMVGESYARLLAAEPRLSKTI
jgi:adenylate cyclase class IV